MSNANSKDIILLMQLKLLYFTKLQLKKNANIILMFIEI